jgi:steroid delta-isomerase-like uncharacterized protein
MDRNQIEAFTARWLAAIQSGNLAEFEHLVSEEVTDGHTGQATRRDAFQERAAGVARAFSDLQGQVDELLIDGDRIAWRWTLTGVQRAPFLGEPGSGQRVRLNGTNFQRLANGVVVVHYTLLDALGALWQMRGA